MRKVSLTLGLAAALVCGIAQARDGTSGDPCMTFDWPLAREQAWLSAPGLRRAAPGDTLSSDTPGAVLGLNRFADAKLPYPPSRAPKPDTYAGTLNIPAPIIPGLYQITLSDEGWIDVFQDGEAKSPVAHTGKRGCIGLRKSLRFQLASKPFVVEISNALADTLRIAVAPVEESR